MESVRIETDGLTLKEALALQSVLDGVDSVAGTSFMPVPGGVQHKSFGPQAGIGTFHILVRFIEGAALGTGTEAARHLYRKVIESVVDKAWDSVKTRLSGSSTVEVGVRLYGADGKLLDERRGKR